MTALEVHDFSDVQTITNPAVSIVIPGGWIQRSADFSHRIRGKASRRSDSAIDVHAEQRDKQFLLESQGRRANQGTRSAASYRSVRVPRSAKSVPLYSEGPAGTQPVGTVQVRSGASIRHLDFTFTCSTGLTQQGSSTWSLRWVRHWPWRGSTPRSRRLARCRRCGTGSTGAHGSAEVAIPWVARGPRTAEIS